MHAQEEAAAAAAEQNVAITAAVVQSESTPDCTTHVGVDLVAEPALVSVHHRCCLRVPPRYANKRNQSRRRGGARSPKGERLSSACAALPV